MELGWLMGHLVYVRGLLPEAFGALAEVHTDNECIGTTLDPLQCALLDLLSEEMENGTTRQQIKCAYALFSLSVPILKLSAHLSVLSCLEVPILRAH